MIKDTVHKELTQIYRYMCVCIMYTYMLYIHMYNIHIVIYVYIIEYNNIICMHIICITENKIR